MGPLPKPTQGGTQGGNVPFFEDITTQKNHPKKKTQLLFYTRNYPITFLCNDQKNLVG
jgi:hypothetical protein